MNQRNEHYLTCDLCNYDEHICQGCGGPVPHDYHRTCERCRAEHGLPQPHEHEAKS